MDDKTDEPTLDFVPVLREAIEEVLGDKVEMVGMPGGLPPDRILHLILPTRDEESDWDRGENADSPRARLHRDWRWSRLEHRQVVLDQVLKQLAEAGTLEARAVNMGKAWSEQCYRLKA